MVFKISLATSKQCTGFFCMDDQFFNHLGPFFDTTPNAIPNTAEKITERTQVLPKAVNNDIRWNPRTSRIPPIYDDDSTYYTNDVNDDEEKNKKG